MFARVMSADIPADRRDHEKIAAILEKSALPVIEKEDGFRNVFFRFRRDEKSRRAADF